MEAAYNPNMPFKWNATRIQVLPNQRGGGPGGGGAGAPRVNPGPGQVNPTATPNQGQIEDGLIALPKKNLFSQSSIQSNTSARRPGLGLNLNFQFPHPGG